jgi:serine/threonine protein kinase
MSGFRIHDKQRPTAGKADKLDGDVLADGPTHVGPFPTELSMSSKLQKFGLSLVETIGRGGMGILFRARDEALERDVAVKVMTKELSKDESQRERFMVEAKALAKLQHPNIVVVYGVELLPLDPVESEMEIFIIMEYLKGVSLGHITETEEPMDWERARPLFAQICSGVGAAHKEGIVHRDIKPDNIFLVQNGDEHIKILDFGLAKITNTARQYQTQEGSVMGSPEYMSPEQAKGEAVDHRADIYAIGAVMYHMLTGQPPLSSSVDPEKNRNEYWLEMGLKIISHDPFPPSTVNPDLGIPPEVDDLIMRCLAKDPAERFQSAYELLAAVKAVPHREKPAPEPEKKVSERELPSVIVNVPEAPKPAPAEDAEQKRQRHEETMIVQRPELLRKKRRKLARAIIGAAAGVGLVSAGLLYATSRHSEDPAVQAKPKPEIEVVEPVASLQPPDSPPQQDSAPAPQPQEVPQTHRVIFNVEPAGVRVFLGDTLVCTTGPSGCSYDMPSGSEGVVFTFRKRGYDDHEETVVPDADHTLDVTLERTAPPRGSGSAVRPVQRPPPHHVDQGPGSGPIRMTPNIGPDGGPVRMTPNIHKK